MKLNKKFLSLIAVSTLGFLSIAPSANALTSEANVNFTNPTEVPDIINPDEPDTPLTPEPTPGDNVNTEPGALTLDYVSHLDFGSHKLSARSQKYSAQNSTTPFAQVTDVRGTGAGWNVTAKLDEFHPTVDGEKESTTSLPGVSIIFDNTTVATTDDNQSAEQPLPSEEFTLASGGDAQLVTNAETNQGKGTWVTRWQDNDETEDYNQSIILDVPAAVATPGSHTANITWTLSSAPSGVTP